MPRRYILLTPADGALWHLARSIARQDATPAGRLAEPLTFARLVQALCAQEAGEREVDVAQMSETLADLRELLAAEPEAVLEVLAGKLPGP